MMSVATPSSQNVHVLLSIIDDNHSRSPEPTSPSPKSPDYEPRNVTTTMNYFKPSEDGSPPLPIDVSKPQSFDQPTFPQQMMVYDMRGSEDKCSLDISGFQVVKHESEEKDFLDDTMIKNTYYLETEKLLKDVTGASKIFIFDHTIRRSPPGTPTPKPSASSSDGDKPKPRIFAPVQRVHIDQSYRSSPWRVEHHLPAEAATLLKSRYQIINVWRPIKPILKDPLAVAEAKSVSEDDLVPIKFIYPDREGESFAVRMNENHKWHYLNRQTPGEVLLIKCFDSKTDGRARRVPHSAFVDEEWEAKETRESIEVRALVFHEDDRD